MAATANTYTVTIQVKEIVYDIQNKTHMAGVARKAANGEAYELTSHMQASDDDDHAYQVLRSITSAIGAAKVSLGEYLNESGTTSDNLIPSAVDKKESVELAFLMPSNFDETAMGSLSSGIHDYITYRSIYDWYKITAPNEAAGMLEQANASLEQARQALYKRKRPERPTYKSTLI